MKKIAFLIFLSGTLSMQLSAQDWTKELLLRRENLDAFNDTTRMAAQQIFSFIDSLSLKKNKVYQLKLDSALAIQTFLGNEQLVFESNVQLMLWYYQNNRPKDYRKLLYEVTTKYFDLSDNYSEISNLSSALRQANLEEGNYSYAYQMLQMDMDSRIQDYQTFVDTLSSTNQSLTDENAKLNSRVASLSLETALLQELMLYGSIAALIVLVILIILLIVQKRKISKAKGNKSQHEKDLKVLAEQQVIQLTNENEQLKKVASLGIDKLNELDKRMMDAAMRIKKISKELDHVSLESTALAEGAKSELPVAIYMSQKNVNARITNQIIPDLNACLDKLTSGTKQ